MASKQKNFGISGIGENVQYGKRGPKLLADTTTEVFSFTERDGVTPTQVGGANATSDAHFVTKAQLDHVARSEGTIRTIYTHASGAATVGVIPAGAKTIISTIEVTEPFDGDDPGLRIGIPGNQELLFKNSHTDLTSTASYQTMNTHVFNNDTAIRAYPSLTSTQGSATITISYY